MTPRPPHLLVIGNGREIPTIAHEIHPGIRTTVMVRRTKLKRVRDPHRHVRIIGLDPESPAEWLATARDIHARDPFDLLGSFSDVDQTKAAAIGADLGLRTHAVETVRCAHDKSAMRDRLAQAGLEHTAARPVGSVADVIAFGEKHGYPLVVKPVAGAASSGVSIVRNAAEVPAAWDWGKAAREPDSNELMVEEFLAGPELSVEAFSHDGQHYIVALTDKVKEPRHCVEIGHMVRGAFSDQVTEEVSQHVTRVLDALGVRDGITHTELILTEGGPRVVETHLRRGGDAIDEMIRDTYGLDLVRLLVRQTLGQDVRPSLLDAMKRLSASAEYPAIWYATPKATGLITAVEGLAEARRAKGVVAVEPAFDVGDRLPADVTDSRARALAVRAVGASPHEALELARSAAEQVTFTVQAAW